MIKRIENLLLALVFGGGLMLITLRVFEGHPQQMLFLGFSVLAVAVVFVAGAAYDRDHADQPEPVKQPQRQPISAQDYQAFLKWQRQQAS